MNFSRGLKIVMKTSSGLATAKATRSACCSETDLGTTSPRITWK